MEKLEFTFINKKGVKQTIVVEDQNLIELYLSDEYSEEAVIVKNILNHFGAILGLLGIDEPLVVTVNNWVSKTTNIYDIKQLKEIEFEVFEGDKKLFDFKRDTLKKRDSCKIKSESYESSLSTSDYESVEQIFSIIHYNENKVSNNDSTVFAKIFNGIKFELKCNVDLSDTWSLLPIEWFFRSMEMPRTINDLKEQVGNIYSEIYHILLMTRDNPSFELFFEGPFKDDYTYKHNFSIKCTDGELNELTASRIQYQYGDEETLVLDGKSYDYVYKKPVTIMNYTSSGFNPGAISSGYMMIRNGNTRLELGGTQVYYDVFLSYIRSEMGRFDEKDGRNLLEETLGIKDSIISSTKALSK